MPGSKSSKILWLPRGFSILFALFIMVFSLDSFTGNAAFSKELGSFFIHSIPTFVILAIIAFTWKKPKITGIFFITFAIGFAAFSIIMEHYEPTAYLLMCLLPGIIGILFFTLGRNEIKIKQ